MKKVIYAMMFSAVVMLASCGNKTTEKTTVEEPVIEEVAPAVEADTLEVEADSTEVEEVQ
jgi:hypothetical protein